MPLAARPLVEVEITEFEQQAQFRLSTSPWNAPIVLTKCKDGIPSLSVLYRRLNQNSKFDSFPLLKTEEILSKCSVVFSTLNLRSGYQADTGAYPSSTRLCQGGHVYSAYTDASEECIKSIMTQYKDLNGKEIPMPVCYFNRTLRNSKLNYSR